MSMLDYAMSSRKYTKEFLEPIVKLQTTWAGVCRIIGIKPFTGAQTHLKRTATKLGIDSTHFVGQSWNKGRHFPRQWVPIATYLVKNSTIKSHQLKQRLIRVGLKKAQCEICLLIDWQGQPIPLELDHKNSDHWDNRLENLQVICPNCHAQETSARIAARKAIVTVRPTGQIINRTCACGAKKAIKSIICVICHYKTRKGRQTQRFKIIWPSISELEALVRDHGYSKAGRILGVTDNAIRSHLIRHR